jgi:hypothetical protein
LLAPNLQQLCKLARNLAKLPLKHYQLAFSRTVPPCECCDIYEIPATVYLNFEVDFVVLNQGFDMLALPYLLKYPVSRLAIDSNDLNCRAYNIFSHWSGAGDWKQLKQVMLFDFGGRQGTGLPDDIDEAVKYKQTGKDEYYRGQNRWVADHWIDFIEQVNFAKDLECLCHLLQKGNGEYIFDGCRRVYPGFTIFEKISFAQEMDDEVDSDNGTESVESEED